MHNLQELILSQSGYNILSVLNLSLMFEEMDGY